jgi:O-antigen ligase
VVAIAGINTIGPSRLLNQLIVRDATSREEGILIQDRNLSARFILWERAIHGIADAPLTGIGLGAFEAISQQPYPQVEGFEPDPDITHVHNLILQAGVDFGVPGLIALIALLMMIGRLLLIMLRQARNPSLFRTWTLGLLATFVAFVVYNMTNVTELGSLPAVAVWFLLGLCVGAGERAQLQLQPLETNIESHMATLLQPKETESEWIEWERRAWEATAGSTKQSN